MKVCENHPQGVVLVKFKDRKGHACIELMNGRCESKNCSSGSESEDEHELEEEPRNPLVGSSSTAASSSAAINQQLGKRPACRHNCSC
ncbi:hypothetical protein P8452_46068 [Trifolium repens]|nr:hypothetical protein P8452_46068 [Trifolium repens]